MRVKSVEGAGIDFGGACPDNLEVGVLSEFLTSLGLGGLHAGLSVALALVIAGGDEMLFEGGELDREQFKGLDAKRFIGGENFKDGGFHFLILGSDLASGDGGFHKGGVTGLGGGFGGFDELFVFGFEAVGLFLGVFRLNLETVNRLTASASALSAAALMARAAKMSLLMVAGGLVSSSASDAAMRGISRKAGSFTRAASGPRDGRPEGWPLSSIRNVGER